MFAEWSLEGLALGTVLKYNTESFKPTRSTKRILTTPKPWSPVLTKRKVMVNTDGILNYLEEGYHLGTYVFSVAKNLISDLDHAIMGMRLLMQHFEDTSRKSLLKTHFLGIHISSMGGSLSGLRAGILGLEDDIIGEGRSEEVETDPAYLDKCIDLIELA